MKVTQWVRSNFLVNFQVKVPLNVAPTVFLVGVPWSVSAFFQAVYFVLVNALVKHARVFPPTVAVTPSREHPVARGGSRRRCVRRPKEGSDGRERLFVRRGGARDEGRRGRGPG
jgi:hypothetical protein